MRNRLQVVVSKLAGGRLSSHVVNVHTHRGSALPLEWYTRDGVRKSCCIRVKAKRHIELEGVLWAMYYKTYTELTRYSDKGIQRFFGPLVLRT